MFTTFVNDRFAAEDPHPVSSNVDTFPKLVQLASGGFVVIWTAAGQDIQVQLFDRNAAPAGDSFRVNAISGPSSGAPAVAALPSGGFVVTWNGGSNAGGDESLGGVIAQVFGADGSRIGSEFLVNTITSASQQQSSVSSLSTGGFVVSWSSQNSGSDQSYDIKAQLFDAQGQKTGTELLVNTGTQSDQIFSKVVQLPSGGFVITWNDQAFGKQDDPSASAVRGQIFTDQGVKTGPEFLVNTATGGSQYFQSAAALANGTFVVVWTDDSERGLGLGTEIKGQIFDSAGSKLGGEFRANAESATNQDIAAIAALPSGGFVVSWRDATGEVSYIRDGEIKAQLFDEQGNKVGSEFMVNVATAGGQSEAAVAAFGSGDFAVTWTDYGVGSGNSLQIRLFLSTLHGTAERDNLVGTADRDVVFGKAGDDFIDLSDGEGDAAFGEAGNDGFYFGAALTAADEVDGGAGTLDQVGLQGSYAGLTLGDKNLLGIEQLVLLPGNDRRFGDTSGALYSYNLTTVDANVGAGQRLVVTANTLRAGENVTFNGSAETDGFFLTYGGLGTDTLTGGQKDDGFFFGTGGRFGAADKVDGQGDAFDQLGLQGDYTGANAITFGADQLKSIEFIVALSGGDARFGSTGTGYSYDLTMSDGNVATGKTLVVSANTLRSDETLSFNGSAETDGRFRIFSGAGADVLTGGVGDDEISGLGGDDRISGGLGADRLTGGEGANILIYASAAESTGLGFDTLIGFDYRVDRIDLPGAVTGFTGLIETGALNRASFDTDLAIAVDERLEAGSAVIFRASAGDFAGRDFAVIDANSDGVYQAGEDFVFEIVAPAVPIAPVSDFFV